MLCKALTIFCALLQITRAGDEDLVDYDSIFGTSPRKNMNFKELAEFDGYDVETYSVITQDGYNLSVFHFPPKSGCVDPEPIVFWHGMYQSSDDCIIPGPGVAHCYIYHENCYDVWVPNSRGNRYSRGHVKLDPDNDPDFWNFSMDDMAKYDVPVVIDFVLEKTGKSQLSYVAHAQGVALLILACAEQPEYNAKIRYGFGLSTTTWLDHSTFIVVELQEVIAPILTSAINLGINAEFLPHGGLTQNIADLLCGASLLQYPFCASALFIFLGYDEAQITSETLPVLVSNIPAGTSLKNFNRWGQIKDNGFSKYDFGLLGNLLNYGKFSPPLFDLSSVTMKWVFLGAENDNVGVLEDLQTLTSNLPEENESSECILTDKLFTHLAFVYGKDVPKLTDIVMSYLKTGDYVGPYANCSIISNIKRNF